MPKFRRILRIAITSCLIIFAAILHAGSGLLGDDLAHANEMDAPQIQLDGLVKNVDGLTSLVEVTNLGTEPVITVHDYFDNGGTPVYELWPSDIPPQETHYYDLSLFAEIPNGYTGYVIITSNQPVTGSVSTFYQIGLDDLVKNVDGATSQVEVTNLGDEEAYNRFDYYSSNDFLVHRMEGTPIPPQETHYYDLAQISGIPDGYTGYVTIVADQPITGSVSTSTLARVYLPLVRRDPPPPVASTGDVDIIDIFYSGSDSAEPDEYVAIRNGELFPIQLMEWTLRDLANHVFVFPDFVIEPGQVCRVYTNEYHPDSCGFSYENGWAIWNNTEDCAYLSNSVGSLIDTYCYP